MWHPSGIKIKRRPKPSFYFNKLKWPLIGCSTSPDFFTKVFQNVTNIFYPKLSGGCHANRDIPKLITDSGLKIDEKDTMYLPGSVKFLGFNYWGVAIR